MVGFSFLSALSGRSRISEFSLDNGMDPFDKTLFQKTPASNRGVDWEFIAAHGNTD